MEQLSLRRRRPSWMTPYGGEGMGDIWSDRLWPEWVRWQGEEYRPVFDFFEKDGKYHFKADLPGVKKEDISVSIEDNILNITGKRESSREEKEGNYYLRESSSGAFSRNLRLPSEVDESKVDAKFKDGVLELIMEPKPSAKTRKIEIKGS